MPAKLEQQTKRSHRNLEQRRSREATGNRKLIKTIKKKTLWASHEGQKRENLSVNVGTGV